MKRHLAIAAACLSLAACVSAPPAPPPPLPRAASSSECAGFADMALVARAFAEGRVDQADVRSAVPRIYTLPDERVGIIALAVIEASYRDPRPARDFAQALLLACVQHEGDMSSVLGTPL